MAKAKAKTTADIKDSINVSELNPGICVEVLDELLDSIMIHGTGNDIIYANRFAYESRGYSRDEMLSMKITDLVSPSYKILVPEHVVQSHKQSGFLFETVHVRKDGLEFPVEVWTKPIIFRGQSCLIGAARDITKRKADREMAQKYLDAAGTVIAFIDTSLIVQNINEFGAELVGYPKEMIIGANCVDKFIPKWQKAEIMHMFIEGFKGNLPSPLHFESPIVTRTGEERIITWRNTFVKDQNGIITGIIISGTDVTEIRHIQTQIEDSYARLERTVDGVVGALSKTVETKDPYTAGHQSRVALLAVEIAKEMNLDHALIRSIMLAATIHDIGKIYVPAEILNKPGALSKIEFEMIKLHPQTGYEVLKDIEFINPVAKMVLQHHERLDGSGYPNGEKGKAINVGARILAVADVVEAMSSHRPYRAGLGIGPALDEIRTKRGLQFDSDVVGACLSLFESKRFAFPD